METTPIKYIEDDVVYYDQNAMILVSRGTEIKLDRIILKLLEYFIENEGKVVSREELIIEVWERQQVSNDAINRAVSILRKSLGGRKSRFIETIPKVGYRFCFKRTKKLNYSVERRLPMGVQRVREHFQSKLISRLKLSRATAVIALLILAFISGLHMVNHGKPSPNIAKRTKILVEPFENFSKGQQQKYFADGLTEEIENNLARLKELFVISPQQEWLNEYGKINRRIVNENESVDYFIAGSVHKEKEQLRISIQLVHAENNTIAFSNIFYQPLTNFFQIQEDISQQVASALNLPILKKHELYSYRASKLDFVSIEKLVVARSKVMSYRPKSIKTAIETLNTLAKSYPKTPEITGLLAFALYQLNSQSNGSLSQSITDIIDMAEQTLIDDEDNLDALYTLANIYIGFPDGRERGYRILKQLLMHHPGKKNLHQSMIYYASTLNPSCRSLLRIIDELPQDVVTPSEYSAYLNVTKGCRRASQGKSKKSVPEPSKPAQLSAIYSLYLAGDKLYEATEWMAKKHPNPRYFAELYDYQLFAGAYKSASETQMLLDDSHVGTWTFTTDLVSYIHGIETQRLPSDYFQFIKNAYRSASLPGYVTALVKEARDTQRPELISKFLNDIPEFPINIMNRGEAFGWMVLLREAGQFEKSADIAQQLLDIVNDIYKNDVESYHFWNMAPLRFSAAMYANELDIAEQVLQSDFPEEYAYWFIGLELAKITYAPWQEHALVKEYIRRIESDSRRFRKQLALH